MPPRTETPQQQQGNRLILVVLSPLIWLHAVTVKPIVNFWLYTVLGAVEESISSLIREGLAFTQRSANGLSAWVLSAFNREYKQQLRGRWQELAEKHSWWKDEVQNKSTFNAVLARSYQSDSGGHSSQDVPSGATAEILGRRISKSSTGSLQRPASPFAAASQTGSETEACTAAAEAALRRQGQLQHPEIEAASESDAAENPTQHELSSCGARTQSSSSEEEESSTTQWWPTTPPAWLAAVSEEAQEAAVAAQERATAAAAQASAAVQERAAAAAAQASAAVQQAANSVSNAVEEAAAAAAAIARNMRAVFGEPQAGWGASEAIRRTGLLEDLSIFSQLFVNRIFDAIRWVIGSLTFVGTSTTPTSQQSSGRAAAGWRSRPPAATNPSSFTKPTHTSGAAAAVGAGLAVAGVAVARTAKGFTALTSTSTVGGGFWAAVRRLMWPWGAAATAGAITAGAAAAVATELWDEGYKQQQVVGSSATGGSSAVIDGEAPVRTYRRSATSVDLVRHGNMWKSDSESDESDTEVDQTHVVEQPPLFDQYSSDRLPSSSSLRISGSGSARNRAATSASGSSNRVAFAPPDEDAAIGAADNGKIGASPFASAKVQEKHHIAVGKHGLRYPTVDRGHNPRHAEKHRLLHRRHNGHQHQQPTQRWSNSSSGSSNSSGRSPLYRTHSGPALSELKDVSSAGQVIRMAGYPLEVHEVVTADGYLLIMERIPQPGATDVVFMMHGVLDTSLTWVAGGVTGSQAFAAWDRGFDVWLGSSRSNPPHAAADPKRRGSAYWLYTNNECGMHDIGAQIDHIHAAKVRELAALGISGSAARVAVGTPRAATPRAAAAASGSNETDAAPAGSVEQLQRQQTDAHAEPDTTDQPAAAATPPGEPAVASSSTVISRSAPPDLVHPKLGAIVPQMPRVASGGDSSLSHTDLHHAISAAEVDAAAAAEAAAAFSRHRAAVAAAGVAPVRTTSVAPSNNNDKLTSWWPGVGNITNFSGFDMSFAGFLSPRRTPQTKRRRASVDLGVAAAAAAVAAIPAAVTGAGAAGVLGVTAAALATSRDSFSLKPVEADRSDLKQLQQDGGFVDKGISPPSYTGSDVDSRASGIGGDSDSPVVCCHIKVLESENEVSVELVAADAPEKPASSKGDYPTTRTATPPIAASVALSAAAAAAAADAPAHGANAQLGSPSLGSSISLRHVLSAPSISLLTTKAAAATEDSHEGLSNADHTPSGSSSSTPRAQQQQEQQQEQVSAAAAPSFSALPQPLKPLRTKPEPVNASANSGNTSTSSTPKRVPSAGTSADLSSKSSLTGDPYNLRVVAHSLGGFLVLIFCTQRAREGRAHHVKRMVLLSPAGFHDVIPRMFKPIVGTWKAVMWYMAWVWRQQGFPVHLPTFVARLLAFKMAVDTSKLPAVGDLMKAFARLVLGGDRSAWDRALVMPHYAAAGMPLLSSLQVMHFCQLALHRRCQLYDYGSEAANVRAYHQATAPVVSDSYHMLRGVPVHLVAGLHDGIIPPPNIKLHYAAMKAAGVDVSYREFDYGHMDFTFSAKEELGYYINSLLMRS